MNLEGVCRNFKCFLEILYTEAIIILMKVLTPTVIASSGYPVLFNNCEQQTSEGEGTEISADAFRLDLVLNIPT